MNINLTSLERKLILDALRHPAYKDKISRPQTPYIARKTYKEVLEKIMADEILAEEIKESTKH